MPYFSTLNILKLADVLFVPGSIDVGYTASKIYPYVLSNKPMISIFNENSSVVDVLKACTESSVISFSNKLELQDDLYINVYDALITQIQRIGMVHVHNRANFEIYMAREMTKRVVSVFEDVLSDL
jgi:hypothetical protein